MYLQVFKIDYNKRFSPRAQRTRVWLAILNIGAREPSCLYENQCLKIPNTGCRNRWRRNQRSASLWNDGPFKCKAVAHRTRECVNGSEGTTTKKKVIAAHAVKIELYIKKTPEVRNRNGHDEKIIKCPSPEVSIRQKNADGSFGNASKSKNYTRTWAECRRRSEGFLLFHGVGCTRDEKRTKTAPAGVSSTLLAVSVVRPEVRGPKPGVSPPRSLATGTPGDAAAARSPITSLSPGARPIRVCGAPVETVVVVVGRWRRRSTTTMQRCGGGRKFFAR